MQSKKTIDTTGSPLWLLLTFILSLTSCLSERESQMEESESIVLKFDNLTDNSIGTLKMENGFTAIEKIIYLEQSEETMIPSTIDFCVTDEYVYIYNRSSRRVMQFGVNGKFVRFLGPEGKGPGEFVRFGGLTANDECLLVWDGMGKKVLFYEHSSGKLLKELPYEYGAHEIESTKNSEGIVFYNPNRSQDYLVNIKIDARKDMYYIKKNLCYDNNSFGISDALSTYLEDIIVFDFFTGHVYSISSLGNLSLKYTLALEDQFPTRICESEDDYIIDNINNNFEYNMPIKFRELKGHILIDILNKNRGSNLIILSKESGNYVNYSDTEEAKSFGIKLGFFPSVKIDDEKVGALVDYHYLSDVWSIDDNQIKTHIPELTTESNAVVIIFKYVTF
jgi:hypothetical protein